MGKELNFGTSLILTSLNILAKEERENAGIAAHRGVEMSRSRLSELCGQLLSHQVPRLDPRECTDILLKKVDLCYLRVRTL